ncbi:GLYCOSYLTRANSFERASE [Salix koriyanagi]|uniref:GLYCOSYLTRANSFERASE n=1 Tax=Salix koriyanagi TaxID=2511006 RepID=A0A9Q0X3J7_9ROSI|nr:GLYCOSYLTRANSFERASE [Salix koriyanagi]
MKKSSSVLYICFGSMSKSDFSASQLFEIAKALAASGQNFIWEWLLVLRNGPGVKGEILVKMEEIEHAITQLMVGEEAEGLRNRTRALKEMARRATEVEGSSYCDLNSLLGDLRAMKSTSY